jgi:hypothetical protein
MSKEILLAWKGYNEKATGTFVDVEERIVVYLDTEPVWAKMYNEQEVIKFAKYCAELKVYDNETYVNNTFEMLLQQFKNKYQLNSDGKV